MVFQIENSASCIEIFQFRTEFSRSSRAVVDHSRKKERERETRVAISNAHRAHRSIFRLAADELISRLNNNFLRPTTLPHLLGTRDRRVSRLHFPPAERVDNASSARIRSRNLLPWKEPAVLAVAGMEEEECEDGNNRPACGRKRSREEPLRGSLRGCTMLLRYRRDVAAARTSNQYGAIGCQVFARVAATCRAAPRLQTIH